MIFFEIYNQSFNDSNLSSRVWDNSSMFLYFVVILITLVLGRVAERSNRRQNIGNNVKGVLIIVACFLTAILGFRGQLVGMDTPQYRENFEQALSPNAWKYSDMEPGYMLSNILLRCLFSSGQFYIFFISAITVCLALNCIWSFRSQINLFWSFAFLVGAYYFQALNLARIYLAASIIMWGLYYLIDGKVRKFIFVVLFASTLHYSSLIMLLPVGFMWLYKKTRLVAILSVVAAIFAMIPLSAVFSDYIVIARYAAYGDSNESTSGLGLALLVDYSPCFFCLYYIYKYKIKGQWADIMVAMTILAFFIRMIAYYIAIAGRLGVHFMLLYVILLPYFVNNMRINKRMEYKPFVLFLFVFLLMKIHMYFIGYLASDGIMPYYFFWNE